MSHGNGTHQLLVYAILSGAYILYIEWGIHTIKKNTEELVMASKETVLEVNAEKTEHMFMS
jgi:hypothetical protein